MKVIFKKIKLLCLITKCLPLTSSTSSMTALGSVELSLKLSLSAKLSSLIYPVASAIKKGVARLIMNEDEQVKMLRRKTLGQAF